MLGEVTVLIVDGVHTGNSECHKESEIFKFCFLFFCFLNKIKLVSQKYRNQKSKEEPIHIYWNYFELESLTEYKYISTDVLIM